MTLLVFELMLATLVPTVKAIADCVLPRADDAFTDVFSSTGGAGAATIEYWNTVECAPAPSVQAAVIVAVGVTDPATNVALVPADAAGLKPFAAHPVKVAPG